MAVALLSQRRAASAEMIIDRGRHATGTPES
jgi:hypothetical protein